MEINSIAVLVVFFLIATEMTGTVAAGKYTIDGNLSDWGVTPFTDWIPDTAAYVEENYNGTNHEPNGHPLGRERYDIEATVKIR